MIIYYCKMSSGMDSCVLLIYKCNGYLLLVSAFRRTMHYTLASHSPTLGAALHSAAHLRIPAIPSYSDMSTVSTSVHPMFHGDPDPQIAASEDQLQTA